MKIKHRQTQLRLGISISVISLLASTTSLADTIRMDSLRAGSSNINLPFSSSYPHLGSIGSFSEYGELDRLKTFDATTNYVKRKNNQIQVAYSTLKTEQAPSGQGSQDQVTFSPVPEADTYMMLLAGLGLMGFVARRRIRTHS